MTAGVAGAASGGGGPPVHVLVVEDDPGLAFGLEFNLAHEGYAVTVAADGPAALERARVERPALIVLDVMLPGLDGFAVVAALRAEDLRMPVLMLTARGDEADRVRGLRTGADDYVTKPFGVMELLARVEALLRRVPAGVPGQVDGGRVIARADGAVLQCGELVLDATRRTVTRANAPVPLAPLEFELLRALLARRGAVASRLELLREVWGYADSVVSRTVDAHIALLRRKLEPDPLNPRHILTVRKAGYRIGA
jgi:DNA-binding response OmpR family regulator